MVINLVEELITLAKAHDCTFPDDFRDTTVQAMIAPTDRNSIMYQDFVDKRPMEVETYLGSPIKLAKEVGMSVPRIETMYALLHHKNTINLKTPAVGPSVSPANKPPPPRSSSFAANGTRPMMNGGPPPNGMSNGRRMPSYNGPPGPMRRGPPPNGFPQRVPNGHANGFHPDGPMARRSSIDEELGEFSHVMLYDNAPEGGVPENGAYGEDGPHGSTADLALRERELALRARELELRERQMGMRRGPPPRRPPPSAAVAGGWADDDEDDDYFDPMGNGHAASPAVMDENFDMMSITSRRNRKAPQNHRAMSAGMGGGGQARGGRGGPGPAPFGRKPNRTSVRIPGDMPNLTESILSNPLMGYSSNRYGNVDRGEMGKESRQNSLTTERLSELQQGGVTPYGAYPAPPGVQRRQSQSPGNPLSPPMKRPSPPNGYVGNGHTNGRPSPPGMRQPVPRYPPGHGNVVAPAQVEQHAGVSNQNPQKPNPQVRSLTGSASASAASGESSGASAQLDSENSSENSSLGPRPVAKAAIRA